MVTSVPIYQLKRKAKQLARDKSIALNKALNFIAKQEGFDSWSLLAFNYAQKTPEAKIFTTLDFGDLVLLGARPGQGKTLMGLSLIAKAINLGHKAAFYTLDYTKNDVAERFNAIGEKGIMSHQSFVLDTSDEICADYIIEQLKDAAQGTFVVIDYLQILDQNRANPDLSDQIPKLKSFAKKAGLVIIVISQIDRSYDATIKPVPNIQDIRLPNPLDLTLFSKLIFLNNGSVDLQAVA